MKRSFDPSNKFSVSQSVRPSNIIRPIIRKINKNNVLKVGITIGFSPMKKSPDFYINLKTHGSRVCKTIPEIRKGDPIILKIFILAFFKKKFIPYDHIYYPIKFKQKQQFFNNTFLYRGRRVYSDSSYS